MAAPLGRVGEGPFPVASRGGARRQATSREVAEVHTITRKPMSWHDNLEEPADDRFLNIIHHTSQVPRKKYPETQTENQEYGWFSEPLVNPERDDTRLNHFKVYNDITLYKAKLWSLGEDDRHK
ncbi:protein FAM183A isoform X2 [Pipistrellus kuhlii]|uniref:Family with sequence similarity 183 member A n=1 Tax=Pipistrellus kuhlii TaxID=59472 RepID=A0A7J8A6L4_PIPKU|nr:protein FAM183A isoform X2 [Pipistrellus kuhlii]KAF6381945.1 family with sequence similarity 183 member A [Pipistrellus kuhlii]